METDALLRETVAKEAWVRRKIKILRLIFMNISATDCLTMSLYQLRKQSVARWEYPVFWICGRIIRSGIPSLQSWDTGWYSPPIPQRVFLKRVWNPSPVSLFAILLSWYMGISFIWLNRAWIWFSTQGWFMKEETALRQIITIIALL